MSERFQTKEIASYIDVMLKLDYIVPRFVSLDGSISIKVKVA